MATAPNSAVLFAKRTVRPAKILETPLPGSSLSACPPLSFTCALLRNASTRMSATTVLTTPPKPKMTALQRAMQVHEMPGDMISPSTTVHITKEEVAGVPGAYILRNVRALAGSLRELECLRFGLNSDAIF